MCTYVGGKVEIEVEQKCFQFIANKLVTLQTKFTYVLCISPWLPAVDAARLLAANPVNKAKYLKSRSRIYYYAQVLPDL